MSNLAEKKGTIAWWLTKNQDRIYKEVTWQGMKKVALELLESPEIQKNTDLPRCKKILNEAYGNKFLSVLVTYMSGIKC